MKLHEGFLIAGLSLVADAGCDEKSHMKKPRNIEVTASDCLALEDLINSLTHRVCPFNKDCVELDGVDNEGRTVTTILGSQNNKVLNECTRIIFEARNED